jgi:hypothetical protein
LTWPPGNSLAQTGPTVDPPDGDDHTERALAPSVTGSRSAPMRPGGHPSRASLVSAYRPAAARAWLSAKRRSRMSSSERSAGQP